MWAFAILTGKIPLQKYKNICNRDHSHTPLYDIKELCFIVYTEFSASDVCSDPRPPVFP